MRRKALRVAVVLTTGMELLVLGVGPATASPAWSAFNAASVSDMSLAVDELKYTLTLGPNPTLTYLGTTYTLNWLQSFCLVSDAPGHYFAASAGPAGTWDFDTWFNDTSKIAVAGWSGSGSADRLCPGQSKQFVYTSLDTTGNAVIPGFHAGYGTAGMTAFFKVTLPPSPGPNPQIPEWGSLFLAAPALPLLAGLRKRRA